MRKTLFCALAVAAFGMANAQVTLYDNGPMVTHAGQGSGGADVSMCSIDPNVAGLNRKFFGPDANYFSVADDFTLSANATLSQMVVYGYETSANTPTWTTITVNLWQGQPGAGGAVIATATSVTFAQTNIFRVFNGTANLLNTARKINAITANFANIPLTAGTTYWVSSQITAGGASGWANMVMDINGSDPNNPITRAGNGLQFRQDPVTLLYNWLPAISGTTNIVQSEFPFLVKGQPASSSETLVPTGFSVGTSKLQSGSLASLAADDNDPLVVCKFLVPNFNDIIKVSFDFKTTKANITAIDLITKAKMVQGGVFKLRPFMHNYTTNVDDIIAADTAITAIYNVFTFPVSGTPNDYKDASSNMNAKILVRQLGPSVAVIPCVSYEYVNLKVTG